MMAEKKRSFSVRIFLPGGEPEGLRIVEKSNWTGQGVVFPRALFAEVRQRQEVKRTGVYVLWGPSDTGDLPRIYVGEGDPVLPRLEQHAKKQGLLDTWCGLHQQGSESKQGPRAAHRSTSGRYGDDGQALRA